MSQWYLFLWREMCQHKMYLVVGFNSIDDVFERLVAERYFPHNFQKSNASKEVKQILDQAVGIPKVVSNTSFGDNRAEAKTYPFWIIVESDAYKEVASLMLEKQISLAEIK